MEIPVVASDEVGLPELVAPSSGDSSHRGPRRPRRRDRRAARRAGESRAEMGRRGRAHVLERCNLSRETARLAELIEGTA